MYELRQTGARTYYLDAPSKIGLYVTDKKEVYLIDSGNNKDAGRRVRKILDQNGWTLSCIINTHSHADHIGGNQYLQKQYHCPVFAPGMEAEFTRNPVLEPSFLYGGYAFHDLRHKFLMAEPSDAQDVSVPGFPPELEIIPLPGHSFDMIGLRTPDDTLFVADSVSSLNALEKYKVVFLYDVAQYLNTLTMLENCPAALYVPAHAEAAADITGLLSANRAAVLETADTILEICQKAACFEDILCGIFTRFSLTMTVEQHVLVGSTIRSYLAWLRDCGKLEIAFKDNYMLWQTIS